MLSIRDVINSPRRNKVKVKRLMDVKRYYLSMYRCYMLMLYDMNYISDPTRYSEKQIIKNCLELGIDDIFTYSGKVDITSCHIKFAMYKNKEDAERYNFLSKLYNALRYKELAHTVDKLYEEFNYAEKESNVIKITALPKAAMYVQKSGIPFDEATAQCISTFAEETKDDNIREGIWELSLKLLDIPVKHYENGVFDNKLTHEEEVDCIEGILNGIFKINGGEYSNKIQDWLKYHRWNSESKWKSETLGLYDYIFSSCVPEIEGLLTEKINSIKGNILTIYKDTLYYNIERESYEMPYGVFSLVCEADGSETFLPEGDNVHGFTGELYTEKRLLDDGITYVGCPIMMNRSLSKVERFYDLEQTDIPTDSWFEDNKDMSIQFEEVTGNKIPFKEGTLQYEIYTGYLASQESSDNLIKTIHVSDQDVFEKAKKDVYKYIEG